MYSIANNIFTFYDNFYILIQMSLGFAPKATVDDKAALIR